MFSPFKSVHDLAGIMLMFMPGASLGLCLSFGIPGKPHKGGHDCSYKSGNSLLLVISCCLG